MKVIENIKFFNKESPNYMSGYNKGYYWTNYFRALIKFLCPTK